MSHDLVGVTEVATMLGVTRQRVTQLAESTEFPPPVADLASGRIWESADVQLWIQAHRQSRNGRPRGGYRIRYVDHHIRAVRRNPAFVVVLEVESIDDAGIGAIFQREFDYGVGKWVESRLLERLPPEQADLSLWRAMAGLATRQLAREIEDADNLVGDVLGSTPMEQRWTQYLDHLALSIRHPIPDLRPGEVTHLWLNPAIPPPLDPANALTEHVHMECGHWMERSRIDGEAILFSTEAICPTCRRRGRVVGLWPQR